MWWTDLLMLFLPVNCLVCQKKLSSPGEVLCLECEFNLPRARFHDPVNNPVSRSFWGRVPVEMGTSLLRFEKGSAYQGLLHDLKYRGNLRAGLYLGRLLGNEIIHSSFSACDVIIPVPVHRKRLQKRGFNQSEIIATGTSEITGIPLVTNLLIRSVHHHSQTSMGRYDRYENISGNFRIHHNAAPETACDDCALPAPAL